tara:strand:+ start:110 stop:697 length:588 start_codon:yes stop_codon:yes gene_type:complete
MTNKDLHDKNTRILLIIFGAVFFMIALSFASVPLYNLFCRVTGFAGTTQIAAQAPTEILDRQMTVKFTTTINKKLPWEFTAEVPQLRVHVGQEGFINFIAHNNSDQAMAGTAIYNVTPAKAGKYFTKTQCFCFDYQHLKPNERTNMPVVFFLDPALAKDPNMEDVTTITLSYSFFKADSSELDSALEGFYNTNTE